MKPPFLRIFCTAAVVLMLLPAASWGAAPEATDGRALAGKLLGYFGLDQSKRAKLESGDVVDNGVSEGKQLPEESSRPAPCCS